MNYNFTFELNHFFRDLRYLNNETSKVNQDFKKKNMCFILLFKIPVAKER